MAALIEIKQVGGFDARDHTDVESSCPEPFPHFDRVSSRALNPVNCLANTGRILAYSTEQMGFCRASCLIEIKE
jgi:hypothetical protein